MNYLSIRFKNLRKINNKFCPFNRWKRIVKVRAEMKEISNREEGNEAFSGKIQGTKLTPEEGENINKTIQLKNNTKKETESDYSIYE